MKTSSNSLLALASLAAQVYGLVQMEVRYSDNMIDVGNADIFAATWQTLYDTAGNERAIMTDRSFGADNNQCTHAEDNNPDLTVRVQMNGAWGQTPGLEQHQMRDALIQSLWEVLKSVSDPYGYEVFTGCRGLTWMESVAQDPNAACGPASAVSCLDPCRNVNSPGLAQCTTRTWGHSVPSSLRVTAYIDGQLQPDDLIITFESAVNPQGGGCGWMEHISAAVAGFIPVAGGLFARGISIACSE
ncbi:uncharacterized protein ColLi_07663 [Neofusicoccum parvum]|nr:uncharacterized protein ColLi_07663 [Neofusicoccum parvum]